MGLLKTSKTSNSLQCPHRPPFPIIVFYAFTLILRVFYEQHSSVYLSRMNSILNIFVPSEALGETSTIMNSCKICKVAPLPVGHGITRQE